MSPWMALYTHAPEELEAARSYVDRYFAHWSSLLTSKDTELAIDESLCARDAEQRKLVFSRELDPVWSMLDRTLGSSSVDMLLAALS